MGYNSEKLAAEQAEYELSLAEERGDVAAMKAAASKVNAADWPTSAIAEEIIDKNGLKDE